MKLYQNTPGMSDAIVASGCGLMCAHEIASRRVECFTKPEEVNTFVDECVKQGIIDAECFVKSWDKLFAALGVKVKCRYLGKTSYSPLEDEEIIIKGVLGKTEHFYTPSYDPWYPISKTKRDGAVKDILVVKILKEAKEPKGEE